MTTIAEQQALELEKVKGTLYELICLGDIKQLSVLNNGMTMDGCYWFVFSDGSRLDYDANTQKAVLSINDDGQV